ncbi:hypothetical protein Mgra_00003374 [Meloidogyne graminicola]|uniref:C2H2-type domain-containing protein n=1 Tax=Meloidogyne graminicola TaxID=189291 RepID=A0A8S9ZUE4_9BILA|nr:hypothetical protein Mgra_00003374 [Meloidogyne graminicola]
MLMLVHYMFIQDFILVKDLFVVIIVTRLLPIKEICKYTFESILERDRLFKCDGCGKSYAQNIGLKIHQEQCQSWLNIQNNGINENYIEEQQNNSSSRLNGKTEPLLINTNSELCNNSTSYPIYYQPINSIQQQTSLFLNQNGEQNTASSLLLEQQQIHAIRALLDLSSSISQQQLNFNSNSTLPQLPSSTILPIPLNPSPFIKPTPQNNQEILLHNMQQNQSLTLHQQIIQQLLAAPIPIEQSLPLVQQILNQFGPLEEAKLSEAIASVLVGGSSSSTNSQFCNI